MILHKPVGLAEDLGARVELERVLRHDHVVAGGLGGLLAGSGPRHLGVAVDRPRHPVVLHGQRRLAERLLDAQDRLGVADVGQLRRVDQVTDRVDAVLAGAAHLVDHDEAALVDLHAGAVEAELVGERAPADRHDHGVDLDRLALAERHRRAAVSFGVWPVTMTPVRMSIFLRLNDRTTTLATSVSRPGRIFGQALEDRDLGTEVGERRRELAADRPAADDGHARRHVVEIEHLVARHDRPAALEVGDQPGHRAGGEDDARAR